MSASDDTPRYPYVLVDVLLDEAEEAGALLFELGAQGIEQRDAMTLVEADDQRTVLVASFATDEEARGAVAELPLTWSPRLDHVVGDAWRDAWREHFEPFRICPGVFIRPPWREAHAPGGDRVLVLEPGRAFGTGLHETTRMVAEAMAARVERLAGALVLDVGCGSGVLSLVALALGARAVRAIDVDPDAVAVTRENAERNTMDERVLVDSTPVADVPTSYPFIVANIEGTTLIDLAPAITARLAEGGTLILSGILAPHAPGPHTSTGTGAWRAVREAYAELHAEAVLEQGEWLAAVLRR